VDDEDGGSTGVCHTGMLSRGQADVVIRAWARKIPSEMRRSGGRGLRLSTRTRLPLIGPLLLAAPPLVICVHNLALPRPGSVDDSRGGSTGTGAPGGGSRGGRRWTLGDVNLAEGGGDCMQTSRANPVQCCSTHQKSAPSLAISVGHACLTAFLAAALHRVVREAVPVQAPASASVVPSASVRVVDTGVSSGIATSVPGRVR